MLRKDLEKALRFYYITDDEASGLPPAAQVEIAIEAGATLIQYRRKNFSLEFFDEVAAIRELAGRNSVPFLVNDDVLLARAVAADGVHLGQTDESPALARRILGPDAIVGVSVSNLRELEHTDLASCDYMGTGPVFGTKTKKDAKPACGLDGLATVVRATALPVVAIGGIDAQNAFACFRHGAAGVAVISYISRAADPLQNARKLAEICRNPPPADLMARA